MDDIHTVSRNGRRYALFFRRGIPVDGVRFLTERSDPMQVGVIEYAAGKGSMPHRHPGAPKGVDGFSEFLYIEKGRVTVTVYDDDWTVLHSQELSAGDFMLFLSGGHEVKALEDCRFIEAKQGPYPGEKDAKVYPDKHENTCK